MAVIQPTNVAMGRQSRTVKWAGLTEADSGGYYEIPVFSDKTVHIYGTFGAAGALTLYGSNNDADKTREPSAVGSTWRPLTNVDGYGDIATTSTLLAQVLENPRYVACEVTAGTGVSLDVVLEIVRKF